MLFRIEWPKGVPSFELYGPASIDRVCHANGSNSTGIFNPSSYIARQPSTQPANSTSSVMVSVTPSSPTMTDSALTASVNQTVQSSTAVINPSLSITLEQSHTSAVYLTLVPASNNVSYVAQYLAIRLADSIAVTVMDIPSGSLTPPDPLIPSLSSS